jgi:hypothetical protein
MSCDIQSEHQDYVEGPQQATAKHGPPQVSRSATIASKGALLLTSHHVLYVLIPKLSAFVRLLVVIMVQMSIEYPV